MEHAADSVGNRHADMQRLNCLKSGVFEPNRVQVFVDGDLEIDVAGDFGQGRFGLYEAYQEPHHGRWFPSRRR